MPGLGAASDWVEATGWDLDSANQGEVATARGLVEDYAQLTTPQDQRSQAGRKAWPVHSHKDREHGGGYELGQQGLSSLRRLTQQRDGKRLFSGAQHGSHSIGWNGDDLNTPTGATLQGRPAVADHSVSFPVNDVRPLVSSRRPRVRSIVFSSLSTAP